MAMKYDDVDQLRLYNDKTVKKFYDDIEKYPELKELYKQNKIRFRFNPAKYGTENGPIEIISPLKPVNGKLVPNENYETYIGEDTYDSPALAIQFATNINPYDTRIFGTAAQNFVKHNFIPRLQHRLDGFKPKTKYSALRDDAVRNDVRYSGIDAIGDAMAAARTAMPYATLMSNGWKRPLGVAAGIGAGKSIIDAARQDGLGDNWDAALLYQLPMLPAILNKKYFDRDKWAEKMADEVAMKKIEKNLGSFDVDDSVKRRILEEAKNGDGIQTTYKDLTYKPLDDFDAELPDGVRIGAPHDPARRLSRIDMSDYRKRKFDDEIAKWQEKENADKAAFDKGQAEAERLDKQSWSERERKRLDDEYQRRQKEYQTQFDNDMKIYNAKVARQKEDTGYEMKADAAQTKNDDKRLNITNKQIAADNRRAEKRYLLARQQAEKARKELAIDSRGPKKKKPKLVEPITFIDDAGVYKEYVPTNRSLSMPEVPNYLTFKLPEYSHSERPKMEPIPIPVPKQAKMGKPRPYPGYTYKAYESKNKKPEQRVYTAEEDLKDYKNLPLTEREAVRNKWMDANHISSDGIYDVKQIDNLIEQSLENQRLRNILSEEPSPQTLQDKRSWSAAKSVARGKDGQELVYRMLNELPEFYQDKTMTPYTDLNEKQKVALSEFKNNVKKMGPKYKSNKAVFDKNTYNSIKEQQKPGLKYKAGKYGTAALIPLSQLLTMPAYQAIKGDD